MPLSAIHVKFAFCGTAERTKRSVLNKTVLGCVASSVFKRCLTILLQNDNAGFRSFWFGKESLKQVSREEFLCSR